MADADETDRVTVGEQRDPRLRTPEGRADVAIEVALEFAETKLSIYEMIYHLDLETHLLEGEQRARLLAGTINEPTEEQIARIARHRAVMHYLQRIAKHQEDKRRGQ